MLAGFTDPRSVSLYTVPARAYALSLIPLTALARVLVPTVFHIGKECPSRLPRMFNLVTKINAAIGGFVLLVLGVWGADILSAIFGDYYRAAVSSCTLLGAAGIIRYATDFGGYAMDARGKVGLGVAFLAGAAACNLGLAFLLVPRMCPVGAACATVGSEVVLGALRSLWATRVFSVAAVFRPMTLALICVALAGSASWVVNRVAGLWCALGAGLVVYAALAVVTKVLPKEALVMLHERMAQAWQKARSDWG